MQTIKLKRFGSEALEEVNSQRFYLALSRANLVDNTIRIGDISYLLSTLTISSDTDGLKTNAIYVDPVFGDDESGEENSLLNKFKSIEAAQSAAEPGDMLIMFPGTYNETGSLGKNGVTYNFPFGGLVNGLWNGQGENSSYSVLGCADMVSVTSVLRCSNESVVNFQCRSMNNNNAEASTIIAEDVSTVNVHVTGDISNTEGDTIVSTDGDTNVFVTANRIISAARACAILDEGSIEHKQIIHAKQIISDSANGILIYNAGGNQEIHAMLRRSGENNVSGAIHIQGGDSAVVNVYGDLHDNGGSAVMLTNNDGILNFYGNISGNGNINVTGADAILKINGEVVISKNEGVIVLSGGKAQVRGRLENKSNSANAHGIVLTGGLPILLGAVIVTSGSNTKSLFASTTQEAIIYMGFFNKEMNNVNAIIGGIIIVDPNVQ